MATEVEKPLIWPLLEFDLPEKPWWLKGEEVNVKKVVGEILNIMHEVEDMKKKLQTPDAFEALLLDMKYNFIWHMAVEERNGVQNKTQSRTVLEQNANATPRKLRRLSSVDERKTVRMRLALDHFTSKFNEMEKTGLLDEEYILKGHKVLMEDTDYDGPCGEFSVSPRTTRWRKEKHIYPNSFEIPATHSGIVDRSNELMEYLNTFPVFTEERILYTVKLASWLLFEYVDLHPFGDGNGRMCRLLCSYIMSTIAPFPVPMYNIHGDSSRDDYVDALVRTRKSETRHPEFLATMLLECLWKTWKYLHGQLEAGMKPHSNSQ